MAQIEVKVQLDLPEGVELLGYERYGEGHGFALVEHARGRAVGPGIDLTPPRTANEPRDHDRHERQRNGFSHLWVSLQGCARSAAGASRCSGWSSR